MLFLLRVERDVFCEAGLGFGRGEEDVGTVGKLEESMTALRFCAISGVLAVLAVM